MVFFAWSYSEDFSHFFPLSSSSCLFGCWRPWGQARRATGRSRGCHGAGSAAAWLSPWLRRGGEENTDVGRRGNGPKRKKSLERCKSDDEFGWMESRKKCSCPLTSKYLLIGNKLIAFAVRREEVRNQSPGGWRRPQRSHRAGGVQDLVIAWGLGFFPKRKGLLQRFGENVGHISEILWVSLRNWNKKLPIPNVSWKIALS